MSSIKNKIYSALKNVPLLELTNRKYKAHRLKRNLAKLEKYYAKRSSQLSIIYSEQKAIEVARQRMAKISIGTNEQKVRPTVFWVGANEDQDNSGFLQALQRRCNVIYKIQSDGAYGLSYHDNYGQIRAYDPSIVARNDQNILYQLRNAASYGRVDLLMGQMWANYVSKEALGTVRGMGIPVVNVSMDDRLPENWAYRNGTRLGAVGLAASTDLVLTTTAEACSWYAAEDCPAIFWPLASDPNVFSGEVYSNREIDVVFVGNRYGIRAKIVEYLISQGIQVSAWGGGWPNGYATVNQCANLFKQAKIILGIGTVGYCDDIYTIKLRDFDAPMSGALYITHRNPDLLRLYEEGKELLCYEDEYECAELIKLHLSCSEDRHKIAAAGKQKAVCRYNWDKRISETLQIIGLGNTEQEIAQW